MFSKKTISLIAVLLTLSLGSGAAAYADVPATPKAVDASVKKAEAQLSSMQKEALVKQRTEDLEFLYSSLSKKHPNMFANTPEAEFVAKKKEIQDKLATLSDMDFAIELQSLAAMIGDSHTSLNIWNANSGIRMLPIGLNSFDGKWILAAAETKDKEYLGQTVTGINHHSMEAVQKAVSPIISFDNAPWRHRQFQQLVTAEELLAYCGITKSGSDVTITVKNASGKEADFTVTPAASAEFAGLDLAMLSSQRKSTPVTVRDKSKYYKFADLGNGNFYIQYNRCQEDPDLPMKTFYEQVESQLNGKKYDNIIIDLRNNGGGSDGVLIPLLMLSAKYTREGNGTLYGLTGEGTFSSALINAVMIKEAGGIIVGEPTGGSVDHFGSVSSFELPNSKIQVSHSNKDFDLGALLEAAQDYDKESFIPDITVSQTLEDYLNGIDTAVNYITAKENTSDISPYSGKKLTRAMLVSMLGSLAEDKVGKKFESKNPVFEDVMPFGYYVPYINWAQESGIVTGTSEKTFEPMRTVTREEMAVILDRFMKAQNLTADSPSAPQDFMDAAKISKWAKSSVDAIRKAGLMQGKGDGTFDPKGIATRSEAEAIIKKL